MTFFDNSFASFNPTAGNPLRSRADAVAALKSMYLPLVPFYSPGGARVRLDMAGARHNLAQADLEGFARPLWGLAPLAAGGGADFVDWDLIRRGLANGTNPAHPEYWGRPSDCSQILVELAGIGFALALIPHVLWEPQTAEAKQHIATYLQQGFEAEEVETNWLFFRLMMGLGLKAMGQAVDEALITAYEAKIDALYVGDGWYTDGKTRRMDYYIPFAFQFYSLLNCKLGGNAERAKLYEARARALAPEFVRWFADDGAALAFGRSLTYRFACGGFWAAMAFADVPALPWGQIKGLVLRHLRWWSAQPLAHRDGVLSIGYSYPNLMMSEPYNSACSPYWAFKAFAFLALPETHPFWTSEEEALPTFADTATQIQPGMVLFNTPGDVIALSSGQEEHGDWCRGGPEKYAKFAYSARYGFGIETDWKQFDRCSFDNMLAFSADGAHFRIREGNQLVKIAKDLIYARWSPEEGVTVETWLLAAAPWHVRVHRIQSQRAYRTIEGGFAVADAARISDTSNNPLAGLVVTQADVSTMVDLGSSVVRQGRYSVAPPNTNLVNARSVLPQLTGEIPAGQSLLVCAVLAMRHVAEGAQPWLTPPAAPVIADLEARIDAEGVIVGAMARSLKA